MHEVNEYRFNSTPHMWIFIKLVLFAFCTFIFKYYSGGVVEEIPDNRTSLASETRIEDANQMNFTDAVDTKLDQGKRITRILITQPSCSIMDTLMILDDICADLKMSKTGCRPQDVNDPSKHKIPKMYYAKNQSTNETENNIVNYIIAALLLTSLGAALLELYRAKTSHQPAVAERRGGSKVSLNRKCSLADLTVLKHNRKELVRRESVLEQTREEGLQTTSKQGGRPSPLHRRCSFPAGFHPAETARISRRTSIVGDPGIQAGIGVGGRKVSVVSDVVGMSTEAILRRSSVVTEESSPERRHYSRLVHRH